MGEQDIWSNTRDKLVQDLENKQSSLNSSLLSYLEFVQSYNSSMMKLVKDAVSFLKPLEMQSFHQKIKKEAMGKV